MAVFKIWGHCKVYLNVSHLDQSIQQSRVFQVLFVCESDFNEKHQIFPMVYYMLGGDHYVVCMYGTVSNNNKTRQIYKDL